MRPGPLIATTAFALTLCLTACSKTEEAAPEVAETEAVEASGVAAMTMEEAAAAAEAAANASYSASATPGPAPIPGPAPSPDAAVGGTAEIPAP